MYIFCKLAKCVAFPAIPALAMLAVSANVFAGATIINSAGDIALGVNDLGHLNTRDGSVAVNASATGLAFSGIDGSFRDATAPGCLCEGWGVSGSGVSGFANEALGTSGLVLDSFVSTASTATSMVHLTGLPGLTITQDYKEAANTDRLFEDTVTITNTTGATVTDLRYVRVMDWDVPLTEFSEFVTISGTGTTADLETSHDNGFETADPLGSLSGPLDAATLDVDFEDSGPADHGAYFKFLFGDLADGESLTFKIFYGAASTEALALAALSAESVELFSLGQSSPPSGDPVLGTPATYVFAFSGVGGSVIIPPTDVSEPASLLLLSAGLLGLAGFNCRAGGFNRRLA